MLHIGSYTHDVDLNACIGGCETLEILLRVLWMCASAVRACMSGVEHWVCVTVCSIEQIEGLSLTGGRSFV